MALQPLQGRMGLQMASELCVMDVNLTAIKVSAASTLAR